VQELAPGGAGVPFRCRGDLQGFEDPADRGCADPVAELEQPALDSLVPVGLGNTIRRADLRFRNVGGQAAT